MKFAKVLILLLVSTVAVAAATSCSKEGKLISSWMGVKDGNTTTLTFAKGGTGTLAETDASGMTRSATFSWTLNDKNVTVTANIGGVSKTQMGTFDGKMLMLDGVMYTKR